MCRDDDARRAGRDARRPASASIAASQGTLERTGATIGSDWVHDTLGVDGTGVGVAIIDSGVTSLARRPRRRTASCSSSTSSTSSPRPTTTTATARTSPASSPATATTPAAAAAASRPARTLLVEKVLDATGQGYISNVIAAHRLRRSPTRTRCTSASSTCRSRPASTSPTTPTRSTLAAKRAVEAGIVVVVGGRQSRPKRRRERRSTAAIGAPGNAPWVLTVGASSHNGTTDRSRRHRRGVQLARPDARSTSAPSPTSSRRASGIESLADAEQHALRHQAADAAVGHGADGDRAVPLAERHQHGVAGRQRHDRADAAGESRADAEPRQGDPAVHRREHTPATTPRRKAPDSSTRAAPSSSRARSQAASRSAASRPNDPTRWSGHIIWGNHRLGSGLLVASANAWHTDVIWGSTTTPDGHDVTWGRHARRKIAATPSRVRRPTRTSCGERFRTARTSSGARARPPTTSSGAPASLTPCPTSSGRLKPLVAGTLRGGCAEMSIRRKAVWGVS